MDANRRTLMRSVAWTVPVIAVAAHAPAFATSLRKDPGINGWVNNGTSTSGCSGTIEVNGKRTQGFGPDGAPFGLYIYDVEMGDTYSNVSMTYWVLGKQTGANWSRQSGSTCWSNPVKGTPTVKADGRTYTPYKFTYNQTCSPLTPPGTMGTDGIYRLYLQDFHWKITYTQTMNQYCGISSYWTQRDITIKKGIDGSITPITFERRNGYWGPWEGNSLMRRSAQTDAPNGKAANASGNGAS